MTHSQNDLNIKQGFDICKTIRAYKNNGLRCQQKAFHNYTLGLNKRGDAFADKQQLVMLKQRYYHPCGDTAV